jgi:hypothetical protein
MEGGTETAAGAGVPILYFDETTTQEAETAGVGRAGGVGEKGGRMEGCARAVVAAIVQLARVERSGF